MKCAVYLRQSEDRRGDALAVSRQREDCLALCKRKGWEPVEYEDNDRSASAGRRSGYERMLADIRAGSIGAVVCWHLDRLHRRPMELESFIALADEKHLALATVTGDVDLGTDNGRLIARITGAVARAEVERKAERQKRQAKQAAEAGKGWGGRRAFGYVQGTNTIRKDEAKLICNAYSAILRGESLYSIAAQWNKSGVTTTVGNQWSGSTVRQVLVNPRYAGKRSYKDEFVVDATWQPIVSEDVWHAVNAILTDEGRNTGRTPGRKYLLTGILRCGFCKDGTTMGSGVAHDDGAAIYVCKRCHRLSRRQKPVDDLVEGLAVGYMSRPDAIELLIDSERHDIGELRERERAILDEQNRLAADRYDPDVALSPAQFKAANDRLNAHLQEVRGNMLDSNRTRVFDGLAEAIAKGAVRKWWDGLPLDRKRAIIDTLMRVTLIPSGRGRPFTRDHLDLQWMTGDD